MIRGFLTHKKQFHSLSILFASIYLSTMVNHYKAIPFTRVMVRC